MKIIKTTNDLPFFDSLFDGFFRDEPSQWMNRGLHQNHREAVNFIEDENSFTIELLAPGYRKEDLQLEVEGKLLKLRAERKDAKENESLKYLRKEFSITKIDRQFQIPSNRIETGEIKANFKEGILSISLPKKEEAKIVKHQIEVH